MIATTAPPLAAGKVTTAAIVEQEEEQKATEETKEAAAQVVDSDETTDVSDDDTVVAEGAEELVVKGEPTSGARNATEGVPYSAERQDAARQAAALRVRQSAALPPGLRERLAALVESGGQVVGEGQALVSIDEAIRAVAESLPNSLRIGGGDMNRPEHPSGESFFSGRSEHEITDQQAEEIARGQLARSGLLRGQRVRVAD